MCVHKKEDFVFLHSDEKKCIKEDGTVMQIGELTWAKEEQDSHPKYQYNKYTYWQ